MSGPVRYNGTAALLKLVKLDALKASSGSCNNHSDPDLWFREDQSDPDYCSECTKTAAAICSDCPIRDWCRDVSANETVGVWAGISRSSAADGRRGVQHTCLDGMRMRKAEWERARRARKASANG